MTIQGFDLAWAYTAPAEGGYSNDPADPGGETMYGITARVARAWGYMGPMKELTPSTARSIAYSCYWRALRGDEIAAVSNTVAVELFDIAFNIGPVNAIKWLQAALNGLNRDGVDYPDVAVDGLSGPATLANLRGLFKLRGTQGETVLMRLILAQRCVYYMGLRNERFLFGWVLQRGGLPT